MKNVICELCQRALNRYVDADGASYMHSTTDLAFHDPVPVEAPEGWRGRCDFCSSEEPAFILPARDFRLPGKSHQMSCGDWAACSPCAELIEGNRWNEVVKRVCEGFEWISGARPSEADQTAMRALYRKLREAISGPLRPIFDGRES